MEQIGLITKPQALKGEFRVKPYINLKQFKKIKSITIDNKEYEIQKVILRDTFVIMKIEGVDCCEDAELLRNKGVFAEVELDKNDNFDLVGFRVSVDNQDIGVITEVNNYGSKDIISINSNTPCMLPLIDGIIVSVENNVLTLNKELFEQVVVYEN